MAIVVALPLLGCAQEADAQTMQTQLIAAAERGDTATVRQLLQQGANVDARDQRGRTPLMAATHGDRVDTVAALIQAGADVNIRDNQLDNPF
jgi:ankyrin repeat protein